MNFTLTAMLLVLAILLTLAQIAISFAGPCSGMSLSCTERADMSTGVLRQHDAATLGVSSCPSLHFTPFLA